MALLDSTILSPDLSGTFSSHLETAHGQYARTRNVCFTAIHSRSAGLGSSHAVAAGPLLS